MGSEDYIILSLRVKAGKVDFSDLKNNLDEINQSSSGVESFGNRFESISLGSFSPETSELSVSPDLLSLETESFRIDVKCNRIIRVCDKCVLALYGSFHFHTDLESHLCDRGLEAICSSFSDLRGSYALVYISLHAGYVVVCKDEYGFKSFLVSFGPNLTLANSAPDTNSDWYELPPFVFLVLGRSPFLYKRSRNSFLKLVHSKNVHYKTLNRNAVSAAIEKVKLALFEGVRHLCDLRRTRECVTVLFSGGLDSSLMSLAVLHTLEDVSLELISLAFDPASPDRITSIFTYGELIALFPNREIRLVLVDVDPGRYLEDEALIYSLSYPNRTHMDLNISASLYYAGALKGHVLSKDFLKTDAWASFKSDSSVLKSINIKVTVSKDRNSSSSLDLENHRSPFHSQMQESDVNLLESPCGSGSRATLDLFTETLSSFISQAQEYVSPSREVLVGSGADELFGGYGRHVSAKMFDDESFTNEINKDVLRLWKRNFGRDDRVLNFRNVSALYPFASDHMVECLLELPFNPALVVDLLDPPPWFEELRFPSNLPVTRLLNAEFLSSDKRGVAVHLNKWLLREVAFRLGLRSCCSFKKRAIQFGTRSAKVFNRLHNMSNRQASNKGAATFSM